MALAALLSTSSAINASLYAATDVTYQLARSGELPCAFGRPIAHSREGLIISSAAIIIMAVFFDLSSIAAIGAISTLVIHLFVHVGYLRLLKKTKASVIMVATAIVVNLGAIILSAIYLSGKRPDILYWIVGFFAAAFIAELIFRAVTGRIVTKRIHNHNT